MKTIACFLFLLMFTAILDVSAQTTGTCSSSSAQIPNDLYLERAGIFVKSPILDSLDKYCAGVHPFSVGTFKLDDFFSLLDIIPMSTGLKIYIGAFLPTSDTTDNMYAKDYDHILVPIFAPTRMDADGNPQDMGSYYIFDPHQESLVSVKRKSAQMWHYHFTDGLGQVKYETHSLWYSNHVLDTWRVDIRCQQKTNNKINKVILTWGVYEKDITDPITTDTLKVKDRLTLLFEVPYALKTIRTKKNYDAAFDTAVPCPPGSNCGTDGLTYPKK